MGKNEFVIDFFELSFLAEACIAPVPIARSVFFDNLSDRYYNQLSDEQRKNLFEWVTRNYKFNLENEDCKHFYNRYNPDNQYLIKSNNDNKGFNNICYLHNDEYHLLKNKYINKNCIIEIIKFEEYGENS